MRNKLIWAVWPGLAVLLACSAQEGRAPSSPVSIEWPDTEPASGAVRASESEGCTLTQGFWKNHPEAWPLQEIMLGATTYTRDEAIVILSTPPARGDATYILAHQLIAAKLNVASGADDTAVADTIAAADAWLTSYPLGSPPPNGADREAGIALAAILDDYNNGVIGPGHCVEPQPSPTPSPPDV